jgi:hypothetical protein
MDPKFRSVYLVFGFSGLAFLIYHVIVTFRDINPASVLVISLIDMVFFYMAYKTYPVENEAEQWHYRNID